MTPLLLDTCAVLWTGLDLDLSPAGVAALDEASDIGTPVHVSAITALEIGLLSSRGRQVFPVDPKEWFRRYMANGRLSLSGLEPEILFNSCFLPGSPPRDPFDRIIIATARTHGMRIVTRDRSILRYAEQGQVLVLEC